MSWAEVQKNVQLLAQKAGRPISIVAVTKGQPIEKLSAVLHEKSPPMVFGESYLQEALKKQAALKSAKIEWHFIGRIQSRKLGDVAASFACIHSIGRLKELEALQKLGKQSPRFYLQVNSSDEAQKNGFDEAELLKAIDFCKKEALLDSLQGLMTLPSPLSEAGEQKLRREFQKMRKLRDEWLPGKLLNMGTSDDFKIAIEEGADVIRLGTVIFGKRND